MIQRMSKTVKSAEELIPLFEIHHEQNNILTATYNGKEIEISSFLFELCDKEITPTDSKNFSHGFDYFYAHKTIIDGATVFPIVYLKKEWFKS